MTYEFHPAAEQDFADAAHWYEDRSTRVGSRFAASIGDAIQSILKDPGRYQFVASEVRVFRLDRWPYKILYQHDPAREHVRILCVMHNKQHPGYWRDRVRGQP